MRKLLLVTIGYTAALLSAHYLLPEAWLLWAALLCALLSAAALFFHPPVRTKLLLVFLAAAVGFGWYAGYTAWTIAPTRTFTGTKDTVLVRIAKYPSLRGDYSSVEAQVIDSAYPGGRILIYDYDAGMAELRPGDLVEAELKFTSAEERYHTEDDYYLANGIHYRAYLSGTYTVAGRAALAWLYAPQTLALRCKEAALAAFPDDVAPLMKALLTGDKAALYDDDALYSALRISGFMHIVSVSGMHVAFLVSFLSLLLGRRRRTALVCIPLILVFAAMIGFTPSVTRAAIMQIFLLLAPVLRRENDPPTALSAALLILLLVNPMAIGSLSLQLSFAAMAGLIIVTPRFYQWIMLDQNGKSRAKKGFFGRLVRGICSALSASVGAIVFTTPLSALYFGFVPLYGILTNLLCLWAMSAAFLCGYFVCILWMLWQPLGLAAGWLIGWLPRYTGCVVRLIARLPNAAIMTQNNLGAWWLVFVYAIFLGTYAGKGKEKYRPILPICASLVTLAAVTLLSEKTLDGKLELTAVDVGQGQCIVLLTENSTVVIDCGSIGTAENAGDTAADYLLQCGRDSVDLLIVTHFHADHVNGVRRLMSRMDVQRIACSFDLGESEYADEVLAACRTQGTEVVSIADNTDIALEPLVLTLFAPLGSEDVNEHCLLIRGDYGDFEFLITGDAGAGVEKLLTTFYELGDMELLVVGHHGSKYSTCDELLTDIEPEYAFISVGAGNSYGHPTEEVLSRLDAHGVEVYRTDTDGTISITVGEENG